MYRLTDRNRSIGEMFSSIAPRYDFLNRLLSLGVDRRWRRLAVAETVPSTGGRFLDVATGTADMALEILRQKARGASVAGVDLSVEMMRIGQEKCDTGGAIPKRRFPAGAGGMRSRSGTPPSTSSCVAFGIRNVADRERGLREMCRAVRPGGRVVVLEFSSPPGTVFGALYRFYFRSVLPRIGGIFSRGSAYAYLPESVLAFPEPPAFAEMMRAAGCVSVTHRPLTFGIVTLYVGVR